MGQNELYINVRNADKETLCHKCGGVTYPVAHLLAFSTIEVQLWCRRCGSLVKQYNRMIQRRKPNE